MNFLIECRNNYTELQTILFSRGFKWYYRLYGGANKESCVFCQYIGILFLSKRLLALDYFPAPDDCMVYEVRLMFDDKLHIISDWKNDEIFKREFLL